MLHLEAGRYDVAMYHWHYYLTRRLCVHHGRRVAKKSQESAMGLHNQIRIQNGAGTKQLATEPKRAMYRVTRSSIFLRFDTFLQRLYKTQGTCDKHVQDIAWVYEDLTNIGKACGLYIINEMMNGNMNHNREQYW